MTYTVVRHSAYGYKGDYTFAKGLESRTVTPREEKAVATVGGKIFTDYMDAENYCDAEMYPTNYDGLIPHAPGRFAARKIDGLAIYLPLTSSQEDLL